MHVMLPELGKVCIHFPQNTACVSGQRMRTGVIGMTAAIQRVHYG